MPSLPLDLIYNLGLTENEGRVYIATLELGYATIQEISKKSGVKRTSIYNFLGSMKARGLLTQTRKKNREYFVALHPKKFLEKEKVKIQEFEHVLPGLIAVVNRQRGRPRVQFLEGVEGVRLAYTHALAATKEILAWSDFQASVKLLGDEYFFDYFTPERIRLGITERVIVNDSPGARRYELHNKREMREMKILPTNAEVVTEINIFNDTVALMSFRSQPPVAVLIEDHAIATTMRLIWQSTWNAL